MSRAVIFDLDETLYPERRFAVRAFAAVACEVERRSGLPARAAFGVLVKALRRGRRTEALQLVCDAAGLDDEVVNDLRDHYRAHRPALRLPGASARVLRALRPDWRLAILTNGLPPIQRHKVAALGLSALVDEVVFASEHGDGEGKPAPEAFAHAARVLGVSRARCVMVGDDPVRDIEGGRRAGMRTIRVRRGALRAAPAAADAEARVIDEVPVLAAALVQED